MVRSWAGIVRDAPSAGTYGEEAPARNFFEQLNDYFLRYRGSDLQYFALRTFVSETNKALEGQHADKSEHITEAIAKDILAQLRVPTPAQVHAFAHVFTSAGIDFYRDQREMFVEAGLAAAKAYQEHIEAAQVSYAPLRQANPNKDTSKPSFLEMLEESHKRGESFEQFFFDRVLATWKQTPLQFSQYLAELPKRSDVKATISESAINLWKRRESRPDENSMATLTSAFGMDPAEGEAISAREKMLWRVVRGHSFTWPQDKGEPLTGKDAVDAAIAYSKEHGHGTLLDELRDAAGVFEIRLEEILGTAQFKAWRQGAKIPKVELASKLIGTLSEALEGTPAEIQKQKVTLLGVLTGREFDIDKVIEESKKAANPGGAMLMALTGRYGMVTVEKNELARALGVPESRVRKMRISSKLIHAGHITEATAEAAMTLLDAKLKPLVDEGICPALTSEQKMQCVDIMTGYDHPRTMLKQCARGEMEFRDMLKNTMLRRDLHQESGPNNFAQQLGLSSLTKLMAGVRDANHQTGQKIADWYKEHYKFKPKECYKVRALAMGIDISRTPDMLLDEALQRTRTRLEALTELYDQTGLSRPNMAEEMGVPMTVITKSLVQENNGRLMCDEDTAMKLAAGLGISTARRAEFVKVFTLPEIARPQDSEGSPRRQASAARRG